RPCSEASPSSTPTSLLVRWTLYVWPIAVGERRRDAGGLRLARLARRRARGARHLSDLHALPRHARHADARRRRRAGGGVAGRAPARAAQPRLAARHAVVLLGGGAGRALPARAAARAH